MNTLEQDYLAVVASLLENVAEFYIRSEKASFGRLPSVDYNLFTLLPASEYTSSYSRLHFTITYNKQTSLSKLQDSSVYGTFVNGKLVGKDKEVELKSGDVISLVHPVNEVFVFFNPSEDESRGNQLPERFRGKYQLCKVLSKESRNELRLAFDVVTWKKRVIKMTRKLPYSHVILRDDDDGGGGRGEGEVQTLAEVRVLSSVVRRGRSPFLTHLLELADTPTASYLVLPHIPGGTLLHLLEKQPCAEESDAKVVTLQLTEAVKFLHTRGVAHKDVRPGNILLSRPAYRTLIKLTNFSSAVILSDLHQLEEGGEVVRRDSLELVINVNTSGGGGGGSVGSRAYLPPELLTPHSRSKLRLAPNLSQAVLAADCWGVGVTTYQCVTGFLPEDVTGGGAECDPGGVDMWQVPALGTDAKHLLKRLLAPRPQNRYTIYDAHSHAWLRDPEVRATVTELVNTETVS